MELFAVGNHAPYHKSLASSGLATEHTVRHFGRHAADIVALQSGAEQTNRTLSALQRTQATDNAAQKAGLAALEYRHVTEMRDMGVSMTGVLLQQMKTLKRLSTIELNN